MSECDKATTKETDPSTDCQGDHSLQDAPTTTASHTMLHLSLLQSRNELQDLRSYSKIKEGQVKALSDKLAQREREIGHLQEQVDALDLRRKTAIIELLNVSSVVNEKQKKINVLKEQVLLTNSYEVGINISGIA